MLVAYKFLQVNVVAPFKTKSDSVVLDSRFKINLEAEGEGKTPELADVTMPAHLRANDCQLKKFTVKAVVSNALTLWAARG